MQDKIQIITDGILQKYCTTLTESIYTDQNGYLVCEGAILGRTGSQQYTENELGISHLNNIVDVYRLEEYVFDSASILSLEGRPLTLNHPKELVNVENHSKYAKGEVFNVRREGDNLVGDIRVFDKHTIDLILKKQRRELSLGYTQKLAYDYDKGIYYFTDIVYNHIALVKKGRAGNAIIKDSFIEDEIDEETFREVLTETLQPFVERIEKLEQEPKVIKEQTNCETEKVCDKEERKEETMNTEVEKMEIPEPIEHVEVPNVEELMPKKEEQVVQEQPIVEEPKEEIKVVEKIVYVEKPTPVVETPVVETPKETTKFDLETRETTTTHNKDIQMQNEFYSYQKLQGETMEQYQQRLNGLVQTKSVKQMYRESLGNR